MRKFKLIFMDGFDEVRNLNTQEVIFSTKLPNYLEKEINRNTMVESVVDNVVNHWNNENDVDNYLLNEENCTQEEREIIMNALFIHN